MFLHVVILGYYSIMTELLKRDIYPRLKEGRILVFPTEESARAVAVSYVLEEKRGLLANQCISFDTFSSLFYSNDNGYRYADNLDRTIFSQWFIEKNADAMEYFYSREYPEMARFLPHFILKMLPTLEEALSDGMKLDKLLVYDLSLIMAQYSEFLKKNEVYELSYQEIDNSVDLSNFYLVSKDAFPKEVKLQRKLVDVDIRNIEPGEIESEYRVYELEKEEIRATFVEIRKLLDSGVGLEEIAISSSALDRLKPYLELEGKLFSIPLEFVAGENVLDSLPGFFLKSILELYSGGYQIDDMKKFFLSPTMPFKAKDDIRTFILKAIQFSISNARDRNDDRYARIYIESSAFSYKEFRRVLDRLMSEMNPDRCQQYFQELLNVLFGPERFIDSEIDNNVFGIIQDNLKAFLNRVRRARENGYNLKEPLFQMFISYLDDVKYVPIEKEKGVKVYPFGQGAATPFEYHFVISLNENESKALVKDASFLSQYERKGIDDEDVTANLLRTYQGFSTHLYLSGARKTYQGVVLPLVLLKEKEVPAVYSYRDSYIIENSDRRGDARIYPLQREAYERAFKSSLRDSRRGEFYTESIDENPYLSYTSITDYKKCHFYYALCYKFGLKNLPRYEIDTYDYLEIGNRLHSILERFDRYGKNDDIDQLEKYFDQEMNIWQEGKCYSYENGLEELRNLPSGYAIPTKQMVRYLKNKYLGKMKALVEEIRKESIVLDDGVEKAYRVEFPEYGFNLKGRIDKIARSKESEDLILYDYKTGKEFDKTEIAEKDLQFYIYKLLVENDSDEKVECGKFIFIKSGKIKQGMDKDATVSIVIDRIRSANNGIKSGDWMKSENNQTCSGCEFKGICRKRFVIQ